MFRWPLAQRSTNWFNWCWIAIGYWPHWIDSLRPPQINNVKSNKETLFRLLMAIDVKWIATTAHFPQKPFSHDYAAKNAKRPCCAIGHTRPLKRQEQNTIQWQWPRTIDVVRTKEITKLQFYDWPENVTNRLHVNDHLLSNHFIEQMNRMNGKKNNKQNTHTHTEPTNKQTNKSTLRIKTTKAQSQWFWLWKMFELRRH